MTATIATEKRIYTPTVQLRDVDATDSLRYLSGTAVPYNRQTDIGFFLESFAPGSLAKSIKESARALPLHLFHDTTIFPIGVADSWTERDAGLEGVWKLEDDELAQRAARMAKDGTLNFMSIRFTPIRSEWTYVEDFAPDLGASHKDSVVRTEARLLETSLVSTPAYNEAAISWVRTGERALTREGSGKEIAGWREYLERMRASEGTGK